MAFEKREIKNIKVTVRFTESEKKIIDEYVEKNGFGNTTEFIRELIKKRLINFVKHDYIRIFALQWNPLMEYGFIFLRNH